MRSHVGFLCVLFVCLAVLGLHCCTLAFSSCSKLGLLCSCRQLFLLRSTGSQASVITALGSVVAAHSLNSYDTWAQLLHSIWNLPREGIKSMSCALAGGFLSTTPPGKSNTHRYWKNHARCCGRNSLYRPRGEIDHFQVIALICGKRMVAWIKIMVMKVVIRHSHIQCRLTLL